MRNFLLPPLHSPPLRSLHRFHSPFSVPPSPSWTALPRRRTGSPRSISFQLRANRGFRGQASMVHRLFVATFPLATGYFIISLRCGKLTPLAVHPFFNDCSQRCFGFFFFLTVLNLANWYLRERNWFSSTINRAKAIISRIRILENY